MPLHNNKLFTEFPAVTIEDWEKVINSDLKGADYEKKLISYSLDGIKIKPYYTADDIAEFEKPDEIPGEFPFKRGTQQEFRHRTAQSIFVEKLETANKKAIAALERACDTLEFILCKQKNMTSTDYSVLFANIDLAKNPVRLRFEKYGLAGFEAFLDYCEKNYSEPAKIRGVLNFDLLGFMGISGSRDGFEPKEHIQNIKRVFERAMKIVPNFKLVNVNGIFFRDAGATPVRELAYAFAQAVEYVHIFTEAGFSADDILKSIAFTFGTGSDYFGEIAKLRTARVIWAKIAEAYGTQNELCAKAEIHSVTSNRNKTLYDPHVNILRTTTEAMSAILGGTDSLTVRPFDSVYRNPDEFSERIARNIQTILKNEAYFDRSVDVAGGAYFIEYLTQQIIEKSWELFLKIEQTGGFYEALKKEIIQNDIADLVSKQLMNIAQKREVLLGTNQYADTKEKAAERIDNDVYENDLFSNITPDFKPIKRFRAARIFEEIRLKTENSGKTPKVFLLTIGNPAMRKARASFVANFFACAGFEIIDNNGFKTLEEGVQAALAKNAEITVLCSSDDEYPTLVPEFIRQLKGKTIPVLAGYPQAEIENFKSLGLSNFVHMKSNIVEELKRYLSELKIA